MMNCSTFKEQNGNGQHGNWLQGTSVHVKGYPVVKAGPLRDQYVHRVVASALLRRPLSPDEQVHHIDRDRSNFNWSNLLVMSGADHGWVSNRYQRWTRHGDVGAKQEADMFVAQKAAEQWAQLGVLNGNAEQNAHKNGTTLPDASTSFP